MHFDPILLTMVILLVMHEYDDMHSYTLYMCCYSQIIKPPHVYSEFVCSESSYTTAKHFWHFWPNNVDCTGWDRQKTTQNKQFFNQMLGCTLNLKFPELLTTGDPVIPLTQTRQKRSETLPFAQPNHGIVQLH